MADRLLVFSGTPVEVLNFWCVYRLHDAPQHACISCVHVHATGTGAPPFHSTGAACAGRSWLACTVRPCCCLTGLTLLPPLRVSSLGDGRTMLHDTKVGELWGDNVEDGSHPAIGDDGWDHAIFRRAHQNAAHLISQGLDPLTIVVDRAHARGMKLYPCLLVQTPPDDGVRCSTWHQEHADEYAIGRHGDGPSLEGNSADCFDFAIPAVSFALMNPMNFALNPMTKSPLQMILGVTRCAKSDWQSSGKSSMAMRSRALN